MMALAWSGIWALFLPAPTLSAPFEGSPQGYTLVAEDDCGDPDASSHVTRGQTYVFSPSMVTGPLEDRDIIFDNDFCVLRYEGLLPEALYKVDVVYVSEVADSRRQSLEANGLLVHDTLPIPGRVPGRFLYDLPPEAHIGGKPVELKFARQGGANAVVSYVRIWSTDPRPLPGKQALWAPNGPIEKDWLKQDRLRGKPRFAQWEDPVAEVRDGVVPCINEQLERGRRMLADFERLNAEGLSASRAELADLTARRDALLAEGDVSPQAWLSVYRDVRWAVRRLAFRNPLLASDGLLFVRRHHAHAMHQCARRLGTFTLPGGDICLLRELRADGKAEVTRLTDGRFPRGTFGRPDLSFDGTRLVFGFAPEREAGEIRMDYGGISEQTAPLYAEHQVGPCREFQVWEMGVTGGPAPRRLTEGPSENSDPLYLPDGRIAFMSHRPGGLVQCGDWALAYCVFTMNPDGTEARQITVSKDGEWDPFLLADGTIGFTRWEYVMKFWSPIQMLWSVRPDGTDPRLIYGSELAKTYAYPLNYASARPVPGTSKLACIGSAHHNTGAGPLCLVDLAIGPNDADGLERVTPVRYVETPDQQPDAGWYDCPHPLNENYYLLSYSFSPSETETTGYALYLFDTYGGKELVYRDEELSALFPVLLRPRERPGPLPPLTDGTGGECGEFLVQDVHEGLAPEARGAARYLQIIEAHERHIHTSPYAIEVGPDSGFETKTVLGTVPVEPDGSAAFRVPAGKSVFFTVLDQDHRALHTMRSVTNLQAGERTACVGCHEGNRRAVPANRPTRAMLREPSDIEPPPWGIRPMEFATVVQPVLDRNCIGCHDGSSEDRHAFDLTDRQSRPWMGVPLPVSYYNLREHVRHAPIFQYFLAPGSFGSRVSPVTQLLQAGHYDVALAPEEWRALCAWIDCNAPGLGDYEVASYATRDRRRQAERATLIEARGDSIEVRRRALAEGLPPGERLLCYLDCGPRLEDGQADEVLIREVAGFPYRYGAGPDVTEPWYDDLSFE
ncbi:MAG: hypothetical protein FJX74_07335, partial [Armatimonadetes bacterium]|nr:hypothetical protein [Armatimonadota bacterium]